MQWCASVTPVSLQRVGRQKQENSQEFKGGRAVWHVPRLTTKESGWTDDILWLWWLLAVHTDMGQKTTGQSVEKEKLSCFNLMLNI